MWHPTVVPENFDGEDDEDDEDEESALAQ